MQIESEQLVASLAKQIRQTYCAEVRSHIAKRTGQISDYGQRPIPSLDGGTSSGGRRYKGVWVNLARFSLQNQLPVNDWIRSVFDNTLGNSPPMCNQLTSETALELARAYHKQAREEIRESFSRQQDKVNAEIRRLQAKKNWPDLQLADPSIIMRLGILVDDSAVTPLFRYCVAWQKKEVSLAHHFYPAAMLQFLARREIYEEVFGSEIPLEFKAAAAQLLQAAANTQG